jgi:hypothetical protein
MTQFHPADGFHIHQGNGAFNILGIISQVKEYRLLDILRFLVRSVNEQQAYHLESYLNPKEKHNKSASDVSHSMDFQ